MPDIGQEPAEQSAPLIWRSRPLRLALAAIPLWFTVAILLSNVAWPVKAIVAIALGVSLANPVHGLLLVALVAPLGDLIAPVIGATNFRISEAVVLAFLIGWLLRALPDRRGPDVTAPWAGWLLATTIAASIAGLAWQSSRYPGLLPIAFNEIQYLYFFILDRIGLVHGARLVEGIGLAAATVMLFRRQPSLSVTLPIALTTSASAAALSSVLLWRGIGSAAALERYRLIGYRVSGHVADVNAAGSYFAMIACLALGMGFRERGSRRAIWLGLAAASGVGLWFSESRSALGATGAVMAVGVLWAATSRFSNRTRAAALAAVILALLGSATIRTRLLEADPSYRGAGLREQFNQTSLRMISARPLFGVGIGQYNPMSVLFLSPQLAWSYGSENAHNYFLQVGGELGLVGLVLFLAWIGFAVVRTARALAIEPRDGRLLGTGAGVMVFVATGLTGHPFLVSEVAYPFWIQFGLMTALAGSTLLHAAATTGGSRAQGRMPRSRSWLTAAAAVAILTVCPAMTAGGAGDPPESQAVDGFHRWETLEDGTRFRWTGAYASLFVPADVTRVEIPVRIPADGRSVRAMGVEVMTAGLDQGRTLVDGTWAILSIRLPAAVAPRRFQRIDLRVDRVWQPALYIAGNADMRLVGVQVGELRLVR